MSAWIRKLSDMEMMYYNFHKKEMMKIRYSMTLNSKVLLEEKTVLLAFEYLYRKVPTLRLCLLERDGEIWFHSMEKIKIDFQMKSSVHYSSDSESILQYPYDETNGPLWCARLYPSPPGAKCSIPLVGEEFPHQYNLNIGFHHTISDGPASTMVCGALLNILDDLLEGNVVNENVQLGYHADGHENDLLLDECIKEYESNPEALRPIGDFYSSLDAKLKTLEIFPQKELSESKTSTCEHVLGQEQTSKLLKKCRQEGVTVNSAFSMAAISAFYQIIQNYNKDLSKIAIPHIHLVNSRRYWGAAKEFQLGTHVALQIMQFNADSDLLNNFWKQTRTYHKDLRTQLDDNIPFKHAAYKIINEKSHVDQNMFLSDDLSKMLNVYFSTSNLGNLSSHFPGNGKMVQATHFNRGSKFRHMYMVFFFNTFRGQLLSTLAFGEEYIPKERAQQIHDMLFKVLLQAVEEY